MFEGLFKAVLHQKMKNAGNELAYKIRLNKLQFSVFTAWQANHRNGNKIRRRALARLN